MARAPQFHNISLALLKDAPHNPKGRISSPKIGQLAKSIQEIGLQYPVLVTEKNASGKHQIIDGHRRVAAYRRIGLDPVPCLVTGQDADSVYAGVNANARSLSGNEQLSVFLSNPKAVSGRARRGFENMEERLGRKLMETMQRHGYTGRTFKMAVIICRACDRDTDEWVKLTVRWFMTCESQRYVQSLLATKTISPAQILRAVKEHRPLKVKVS